MLSSLISRTWNRIGFLKAKQEFSVSLNQFSVKQSQSLSDCRIRNCQYPPNLLPAAQKSRGEPKIVVYKSVKRVRFIPCIQEMQMSKDVPMYVLGCSEEFISETLSIFLRGSAGQKPQDKHTTQNWNRGKCVIRNFSPQNICCI